MQFEKFNLAAEEFSKSMADQQPQTTGYENLSPTDRFDNLCARIEALASSTHGNYRNSVTVFDDTGSQATIRHVEDGGIRYILTEYRQGDRISWAQRVSTAEAELESDGVTDRLQDIEETMAEIEALKLASHNHRSAPR